MTISKAIEGQNACGFCARLMARLPRKVTQPELICMAMIATSTTRMNNPNHRCRKGLLPRRASVCSARRLSLRHRRD